jgi:hypothetical protein
MSIPRLLLLVSVCVLTILGGVIYFLYREWYIPRRSRLIVDRLRREDADGVRPSPRDYRYAIAVDASGFNLTDLRSPNEGTVGMPWAEICRAIAFKRDLFTVDRICLFLARRDGAGIELDEEMAGWLRFVEALPAHLPSCTPFSEWFPAVAFPAFARNDLEIWASESVRSDK